jgi:hypothetical protein
VSLRTFPPRLLLGCAQALLRGAAFAATGVQLFSDYVRRCTIEPAQHRVAPAHHSRRMSLQVRAFHTTDPWLLSGYLGGDARAAARYARLGGGTECDSSVVLLDKRRAWQYLHVVLALNWWRALTYRHTWGDKDTWLLAAVAQSGAADTPASTQGTRVGWLTRRATVPPTALWGHMQFGSGGGGGAESRLLYLNWQPHYAAGYIEFGGETRFADALQCCVFLDEHWAVRRRPTRPAHPNTCFTSLAPRARQGPHDEDRLQPSVPPARYTAQMERTFNSTRSTMRRIGLELRQPSVWGQVRYRRCAIYFGLLLAGSGLALRTLLTIVARSRGAAAI